MPKSERPRTPTRVLIVEDELMNRMLYSDILALHGHLVEGVESIADARSAFERARPDAIVLEHQLARRDESGFLQAVLRRPVSEGVAVILVSASSGAADRKEALAAGAAAFVAKPINVREFPEIVARALLGRGGRRPDGPSAGGHAK
ncbi:MAG: response regulator [Planctomycetes bacterium]|nr:response regulator [Planctomycetota bacterium]